MCETVNGISLATLHYGLRVTYGDAQPKNIVWNHTVDAPWGVDFEDARRHTGKSLWDFEDEVEADIATLFQPVMRSEDIFEHVADTYSSRYYDITEGERAPVSKDAIIHIRGRHLQPLSRVNR